MQREQPDGETIEVSISLASHASHGCGGVPIGKEASGRSRPTTRFRVRDDSGIALEMPPSHNLRGSLGFALLPRRVSLSTF